MPLKRVAKQTLLAVFRSQYRATETHLRAFFTEAAGVTGFPEAFASVLAANLSTVTQSFGSARLIALRMSCTIVDVVQKALTTDETQPAWLAGLLTSQSLLLESMLNDSERLQTIARSSVERLLRSHFALLPLYAQTITSASNDVQQYQLWLVLRHVQLEQETVEKLWATYAFWAFESKTRTFVALQKNDVRLKDLTYEQFDVIIKPVMSKMLKKSPDSVLEAVGAFVFASPLDFGRYLQELFLSMVITKLRSQKDDVRGLTITLAKNLLMSFQDVQHVELLTTEMGNLLDGKHGILAQFYQREAGFAVLSNAADSPALSLNAEDAQAMANAVIAALLKAINKEAHDQTRYLGLLALGKWLTLAQEVSADSVTKFKAGLTSKNEAVVAGYLRALTVFARSAKAANVAALNVLANEVIAITKESNKKATVLHLDGVLAVGLAGLLALSSSELDKKFAQEGVTDLLLNGSSFLDYSVRTILNGLNDNVANAALKAEVAALAALPSALSWVLSSEQSDSSAAYKLLVDLLCCSVRAVRESAEASLRIIFTGSLAHCEGLVQAFRAKLTALAIAVDESKVFVKASAASDDTTEASIVPPAGVLRRALRAIVSEAIRDANETRAAVFAPAFLLAHHPYLVDGKSPTAFGREWNYLKVHFLPAMAESKTKTSEDEDEEEEETNDDRIDHLIEADENIKKALVDILANVEHGALYAEKPVERLAGQRMLASLLNFAGNGEGESVALHEIIQEQLVSRIDSEDIASISALDVNIYWTPDDELFVVKKNAGQEETVMGKKKRGGAHHGTEDERWEQQVREELEQKKAAAKKVTYTREEKELLAQQQARREQLRNTRKTISLVLESVDMLARNCPDEFHPALPYLLRSVSVLSTCSLFEAESATALRSLGRAICPHLLRSHHDDVSSSLRVVLAVQTIESTKAKTQALTEMTGLFTRTLAGLMEYVFGFQFDTEADFDDSAPCNHLAPPTFHLVFPVLRMLILHVPELRRWALPLFAAHARMIPEEEEEEIGDVAAQRLLRKEMIELALHLLVQKAVGGSEPITNPDLTPGRLLANLSLGPALSAGEWAPILGDDGLLSEHSDVRLACLKALLQVAESNESELRTKVNPLLTCRLFCCCFDSVEGNKSIAKAVWDATECKLTRLFAGPLLVLLNHMHGNVRESAALAIAEGMKQFPETITPILNNLKAQFDSNLPKPLEVLDEFGIPKVRRPGQAEPQEEPQSYLPRCGVALCLEKSVSVAAFSNENVQDIMSFVINHGLADSNAAVRTQMRKTGIQIVDVFGGGANTSPLLQSFEKLLDKTPSKDPKEIAIYDHQREGVVVFLGALAKHMDKTDPKVSSIVDSLLEALSIPSESVQRSVATCLSPLIPAVKARSMDILDDLLKRSTSGETFGERIGAAYGVSAVVKGLGISALKQHDIIPRLEDSMKGGGANARQGAMLVFECLSQRLGILFEPYIIVILPIMLKCFADASTQVRDAASQTAKGIMANLSAHGVKLVLPSLLTSLEDNAWRTKQAGIQILGSMAYCAPRQLGSCLPQVVPKLTTALTDSHPKVRDAGKSALRDIGSVVRNPEIASISNALLNALEDPNKYTTEALQQLQSTSFVHSIDAPSLALVMPIITRGLKDRGGEAKKKSALIVGSMCSMINDAKDLIPYMEMVLPSLKTQLVDPIPEVRAVAAKAMGKLVKGLGEKHFSDILTWLLEVIKGDFGSVERSGAAQGLCEVLVALGKERVEATLFDEIFPLARHPKFSVREGVLWIIAFLPPAFGKGFSVFLHDALPIVVAGLSDEAESVRDVAMHSGHVVVNAHALSHTKDILPSLEAGLFDDSWRIRQSSVTLLGDLMYRISGTRAVGVSEANAGDVDEDDDAAGSAAGDKAIIKILGMDRRNAILASLYMIRSDTSAVVRQSALQVWKSVVPNTPKTLRQILDTLMGAIVNALAGNNLEKQTMAGRTLGEIVRKLGEHVMPDVVPILRAGLSPKNSTGMRQGACIGLAELIDSSTKKQLEDFVDTLVDAILDGLCDESPLVISSAAQAFDVLQKSIGYRAIDETVPHLLQRIKSTNMAEQERALHGLQEILRVKSREVLPYLIPRLLVTPLSNATVRALSRVAQATGPVIHYQIERVFATLIGQYVHVLPTNPQLAADIKSSLTDITLSVQDVGVHWLVIEVCKYCESEVVEERTLAFEIIAEFCSRTDSEYNDQAPMLLKQIVVHLNDTEEVVKAASNALKGMNVTIRPEVLCNHLDFIRQTINSMVSDARHRKGGVGATGEYLLPGLCIPKGLEPFLPSYQHALMNGSPELRQSAAAGLGELVLLSSTASLRPYLIKLTGPLIRIAGDRFPGHVKAAILQTLEIILGKGGVALKPFLPQLQTTFVKALNDTAAEVRTHGTSALTKLVSLSPRVDPLIAELTEKLKTTTGGIREANLDAITSVVQQVGDKISAAAKTGLEEALVELLESTEDSVHERSSRCLAQIVATDAESGAASRALSYALVKSVNVVGESWARRHSAALFMELVLQKNPSWAADVAQQFAQTLTVLGMDDHVAVRSGAMTAIGALVKQNLADVDTFIPILVGGIEHTHKDVCKSAVKIAKRLAKRNPVAMRTHLPVLVPSIFQLIKGNNIAVKNSAERSLLYLLEVQSRPETLATFVRTADAVNGKVIAEYSRRVLAKLKTDSGDESD